jgi:hypothetical protein
MKQAEPSNFQAEVHRAIDCAAKASSCGKVDFRAFKPSVVTLLPPFHRARPRASLRLYILQERAHRPSTRTVVDVTSDTNVIKQQSRFPRL